MRQKLATVLREMFFGALALGILYDQVFVAHTAQPLLVFLAIFFLGSIPALRGDKKDQPGPFAQFIMALMGVTLTNSKKVDGQVEQEDEQDDS